MVDWGLKTTRFALSAGFTSSMHHVSVSLLLQWMRLWAWIGKMPPFGGCGSEFVSWWFCISARLHSNRECLPSELMSWQIPSTDVAIYHCRWVCCCWKVGKQHSFVWRMTSGAPDIENGGGGISFLVAMLVPIKTSINRHWKWWILFVCSVSHGLFITKAVVFLVW